MSSPRYDSRPDPHTLTLTLTRTLTLTLTLTRYDSRPSSPRRASGGGSSAFGSSSPRNLELWTGRFHETLQGGGTFNDSASRAPGTYSDRPSSPGPGDYEARPTTFSRGAPGRDARGRKQKPSAAFASASVRLISADGGAAEARGRCGEAVRGEASPGAGHYAPVQTDSIAHKAAQLARHAARANARGLRAASAGKLRSDRFDGPREVTPGPGAYLVAGEKASTNERRKTERSHNSAFLSGSRRVMPWNGMAEGAVRRTSRSRLEEDKEEARNETPGPGAYLKLDLSTATMRRGGSTPTFGASTSPRFDRPPTVDNGRMTPSPVHYSSDQTRPSRG